MALRNSTLRSAGKPPLAPTTPTVPPASVTEVPAKPAAGQTPVPPRSAPAAEKASAPRAQNDYKPSNTAKGTNKEEQLVRHLRSEESVKAVATALGVLTNHPSVQPYLDSAEAYLTNKQGANYEKLLQATPTSIVNEVAKLAALKLKLNEAQGTAYLATSSAKRKDGTGYDIVASARPGIRGQEQRLRDEGVLATIDCNAVRRQDHYEPMQGTAGIRKISFRRNPTPDFSKPNDIIASYAVLTAPDGREITVTRNLREAAIADVENTQAIAAVIAQRTNPPLEEKTAIEEARKEYQKLKSARENERDPKRKPPTPLDEMGIQVIAPGYSGKVKSAEYTALREALRIACRIWSRDEKLREMVDAVETKPTPRAVPAPAEAESSEETEGEGCTP